MSMHRHKISKTLRIPVEYETDRNMKRRRLSLRIPRFANGNYGMAMEIYRAVAAETATQNH